MIRRSIAEWDYLPVTAEGSEGSVTRKAADELVEAARLTGLGGEDGEGVLINGARYLRARQAVGVISTPNVTLEILPKIDGLEGDQGTIRQNLVHMLATVYDLDVRGGAIAELSWQRDNLLEIVIRLFCDRLFSALHKGMPRAYRSYENDLGALRERLNVKRQFTILAAAPHRLASLYEELSEDTAINRIMKAVILALRTWSRSSANQRRLYELSLAYDMVTAVPPKLLPWKDVILDRTNTAWHDLIRLARVLLFGHFQTTSGGTSSGFALLFQMNDLFEEYIGRLLHRTFRDKGYSVSLQGPAGYTLHDIPTGQGSFKTVPDIVITRNGTPALIMDTKWKRIVSTSDNSRRGVSQADIYQMVAYGQVYRCDRMMLLFPHSAQVLSHEGVISRGAVAESEGRSVSIATIDLQNLSDAGRRLTELVRAEINPAGEPY